MLKKNTDYFIGSKVTGFEDVEEGYFCYTIPTGNYVKVSFNSESFEELVDNKLQKWRKLK